MSESFCSYHLEPVPGMELVRKNFEAIKGASSDVAQACSRMDHIPLSTRFMLLERGYLLVRDDKPSKTTDRKVYVGEAEVEGPIILQQD